MFVAVDKLRPTVDRLVPDSKLMHSRNVESRKFISLVYKDAINQMYSYWLVSSPTLTV